MSMCSVGGVRLHLHLVRILYDNDPDERPFGSVRLVVGNVRAFERTHHHAHLHERIRVADVVATGKLLPIPIQMLGTRLVVDAPVPSPQTYSIRI